MKLSILVPCFNEVNTIHIILAKILAVHLDIDHEILIVDDMSTDGTREYLKRLSNEKHIKIFFHRMNQGKGAALRTAYKYSTGDIVLFQDADLEYSPEDYPQLLKPILHEDADVVYGSRMSGGAMRITTMLSPWVANRVLTIFANLFTTFRLTDVATGYKVIRKSLLDQIELQENGFGIDVEITAKISKLHCRFCEVPITYTRRRHSEGKKLKWRDGLWSVFLIMRYGVIDAKS